MKKSFDKALQQDVDKFQSRRSFAMPRAKSRIPARTNVYPGSDLQVHIPDQPITQKDMFKGSVLVPLQMLPPFKERKATKIRQRRQGLRPFPGVPMTAAQMSAKRRSAQFYVMKGGGRSSQAFVSTSRDSLNSLQTVLGSLQEENLHLNKSIRKSRAPSMAHPQQEEIPSNMEGEQPEDKAILGLNISDENEDDMDRGRVKSKIHFEIPDAGERARASAEKPKVRQRRPTSVRTTRFTVPNVEGDRDANVSIKIKARRPTSFSTVRQAGHKPVFDALPDKVGLGREESQKIRERRPTPMLGISPMFAQMPAANNARGEKPINPLRSPGKRLPFLLGKVTPPAVGLFRSTFHLQLSQKIRQRGNKTQEPNEAAQELKKSNLPTRGCRPTDGTGGPMVPDPSAMDSTAPHGSIAEAVRASTITAAGGSAVINDAEDHDSVSGLMRIRKRRNIGRMLSPPYARNERSDSLAVMDFRNSMFYKRKNTTATSEQRMGRLGKMAGKSMFAAAATAKASNASDI